MQIGELSSTNSSLRTTLCFESPSKIDWFVDGNIFDIKLRVKYSDGSVENLTFTRNTNIKNTGWYSTLLPATNPVQIEVTDLKGQVIEAQVETCSIRQMLWLQNTANQISIPVSRDENPAPGIFG